MNICAVMVTYGDRIDLLQQVIAELLHQPVGHIIVVSNNAMESSRQRLMQLEQRLNGKLRTIYLEENTGSAKGYTIGMQQALKCPSCEFVWLLDDDNMPQRGALDALIAAWGTIPGNDPEENIALVSYRGDVGISRLSLSGYDCMKLIKRNNYFLRFHIKDICARFVARYYWMGRHQPSKQKYPVIRVPYAGYGGLFFHRRLIDAIGYPREDYYLYVDDHEFTYRLTKRGGMILLVPTSKIDEIDKSWLYTPPGEAAILPTFLRGDDLGRLYYTVRNNIIFDRENFNYNHLAYSVNKCAYLSYLKIISLLYRKKRHYETILKAVSDGEKKALGKT